MNTSRDQTISEHYSHGQLVQAIVEALKTLGKDERSVTVDDLAMVDEFHIGGRQASRDFLEQLELRASQHVFDIGCGLGGTSRFVVVQYGCRVSGIDLTPEFVATARTLNQWLGLESSIVPHQGSALATSFGDNEFDAAYLLHVGMNVQDKAALFAEVARVLKPGSSFGIYDVMRTGPGDLSYPVPWAQTPETSFVCSPEDYKSALRNTGFEVVAERNRHGFAIEFFTQMKARMAEEGGPAPLGLHIVMGEQAPVKVANMMENISMGWIAPVEIIARCEY